MLVSAIIFNHKMPFFWPWLERRSHKRNNYFDIVIIATTTKITMSNHKRTSSRDNSYDNDEYCFLQEPRDMDPPFIIEHIDEENLMDVALSESSHNGRNNSQETKDLYGMLGQI